MDCFSPAPSSHRTTKFSEVWDLLIVHLESAEGGLKRRDLRSGNLSYIKQGEDVLEQMQDPDISWLLTVYISIQHAIAPSIFTVTQGGLGDKYWILALPVTNLGELCHSPWRQGEWELGIGTQPSLLQHDAPMFNPYFPIGEWRKRSANARWHCNWAPFWHNLKVLSFPPLQTRECMQSKSHQGHSYQSTEEPTSIKVLTFHLHLMDGGSHLIGVLTASP